MVVGTICIVQDDLGTKQSQLDATAGIYTNSYLTIVDAYEQDENASLSEPKSRSLHSQSDTSPPDDVLDLNHVQIMKWYAQNL